MGKLHTQALELLKDHVDRLTREMVFKEQKIAALVSEAEELQSIQNELIESIKHLGASNVEQTIPSAIGNVEPVSTTFTDGNVFPSDSGSTTGQS